MTRPETVRAPDFRHMSVWACAEVLVGGLGRIGGSFV